MATTGRRPVFLNLAEIKLPLAGYLSILHRVSGALMFLATPLLIYLLDLSLSGEAGYARADELVHGWFFILLLFVLVWSLLHHLLAGIRYLLIDVDIGVDKPHYRQSALAVLVAAPLLALIVTGVIL
jgi:succinate dehydrogenase / fumarate reductase cytochrome b subunit